MPPRQCEPRRCPHEIKLPKSHIQPETGAIARALHFGARLLVLDEPTASLGVRESATVLRLIDTVRTQGVAVVFITHNAYHAHSVGDEFLVLRRGETLAAFSKVDKSIGEVTELMAGGAELRSLLSTAEVDAMRPDGVVPGA